MNARRAIIAEQYSAVRGISQGVRAKIFPRIVQHAENQAVTMLGMDYKKEAGRRIRAARDDRGWTLAELSQKTGDILSLKRINAYENGDRMIGPSEAATLAKALGVRPAYLMLLDDIQLPITKQEETLIRNWRTLPERERMEHFRAIQALALTHRDPVQDRVVEQHYPKVKSVAPKQSRKDST